MPREYGYATTKENPVNAISSGGNKDIIELLTQLMGQKGAPKGLADILAALKAGYGSANIVKTSNTAQALGQASDPFTYGRDATGPTKGFTVPMGPAGTFAITPSGDTADVGRALNQGAAQPGGQPGIAERDQLMRMIMKMRKKDKSLSQWNNILGGI